MIYTLTLNPAIDYVCFTPRFNLGEINRSDCEKMYAGGKGINVSALLCALNIPGIALGFVAGHTGEMLKNMLQNSGVPTQFITLPRGNTRINVKIKSDFETDINGGGPRIDGQSLKALYQKLQGLCSGDTLVMAGSVPPSLPGDIYCSIMDCLKNKNIRFVVDATGDTLVSSLKHKPFLIKPNNFELCEIAGKKLETKDEITSFAKELQKKGAQNVLVSLGASGAILVADDGIVYEAPAPKGKVINTTGAGDSMVAGFLAGLQREGEYSSALRYGICAGSATSFSESLADADLIQSILKDNSIKVTVR